MKKQLVLIAFMMAGTVVFAQQKDGGHRHNATEEMKTELSLNDSQYGQIKTIDKSYRARFHDLRIDSTMAKEDRMKAMRSLGDARKKEIEGVLTEDQKTQWNDRLTTKRNEHRAHSQSVAENRANKIRSELSLSDAQFDKFGEINKRFSDEVSQLKQKTLSDESRKAEFKKLRGEYDKSMKKMLTRAQYKQWTEMKKTYRNHHGKHTRDGAHRS